MAARVYCAVLLCLSGCWSSTEAAPGQNFTANPGEAKLAINEKCCSNGCGLECLPPIIANPGVCPIIKYKAAEVCTRIGFMSCADDSDCAKNEKCCYSGCRLQCMAPVTVKPGVCPITKYEEIRCITEGLVLCAGDSECPKNQKCCRTACGGSRCTAPVTVKPGVCPSYGPIVCMVVGNDLCASDSECPNNQKCCNTACGGRRCTAPVTVKPGVCPRTNYEEIRCIMMGKVLCASDSECPKNQKCCNTACGGRQCTAPVTVKPGVCPRTKYGTIMCLMKDKDLCASDSECPKKEKCCGTACGGTRCTAPVTANPGVCPSTKYKPAECALIRYAPCGSDSDCANNQKCCSNGCGLQCQQSLTPIRHILTPFDRSSESDF